MVGETVSIEFTSTDAQTAAAVTLKDANGATRTLAATERLLIDDLSAAVVAADAASASIRADVIQDTDADGAVDGGELIASFIGNSSVFEAGEEGFSVKTGLTPKVKATAAGVVRITGSGRIVKGQTEGVRPSWRERQLGQ